MKNQELNRMVKVSLLGVIGFLLMIVEFPIPLFPEFLKIDLGDLPALIGAFALGPMAGVMVELMKNLLHGIFFSKTMFIGDFANFIIGSTLIATAGTIYKMKKTKKRALIGIAAGTLFMCVVAGITNYYIFLPLYEKVLHVPIAAMISAAKVINPRVNNLNSFIVWVTIPFNLMKGILISVITMAVYKKVSPILHSETEVCKKAGNNC